MVIVYFLRDLIYNCQQHDIFATANQITYRLVISMFPFIAFLLSLVGFFNFEVSYLLDPLHTALPAEIVNLVHAFVGEVIETKNTGVLSISLGVLLMNASAGYSSIAKGFSRAYHVKEERSFFRLRIMGVLFVPFFATIIVLSALLLVYGDKLIALVPVLWYKRIYFLLGFTKYLVALLLIQVFVALVYRLTVPIKINYIYHVPGSLLTAVVWVISTKIFNIYVNNYAKYSMIYGSVASLFILMVWLNMISLVLLIGCEFNALFHRRLKKTLIPTFL